MQQQSAQMVTFRNSLRGRLLLFGVLPTFLVIAGIITHNSLSMYSLAREENEQMLRSIAVQVAEKIERGNTRAVMAAKIMALAQVDGLFGRRQDSSELAKHVLEMFPEFTGAYFGYEPNADQDDRAFLLTEPGQSMAKAMNREGRFIPYWYRDIKDNQRLQINPLIDMETSLYYDGMKKQWLKSGADSIVTEPYIYEGKMIVEQTSPIIINGQFKGIGGVDRALTDIEKFLKQIKQKNGVDIFLISRSGKFIAVTLDQDFGLLTKSIQATRLFNESLMDDNKVAFPEGD